MPEKDHSATHSNCLDVVRSNTLIVADTADFSLLKELSAQDGTTNPTLILRASKKDEYKNLLADAINRAKAKGVSGKALIDEACDQCSVAFGCEILKIVPGVVSTEVDAKLSFDVNASVEKARKIIGMYSERGIGKDRVLIKMASTWEGCQAAKILEAEGIRTNMTLLFTFAQACAAAEAGAYLISPFVGRILDFYKSKNPTSDFNGLNDPGVLSVTEIFHYYKKFGYNTIVMGASFRNIDEVKNLNGCDRVTVSPQLLEELKKDTKHADMSLMLDASKASERCEKQQKLIIDEPTFRWMLNEDEMATVKLSDGIRAFNEDYQKLQDMMKGLIEGAN